MLSYNEKLQRYSVKLHRQFQSYSDGARTNVLSYNGNVKLQRDGLLTKLQCQVTSTISKLQRRRCCNPLVVLTFFISVVTRPL